MILNLVLTSPSRLPSLYTEFFLFSFLLFPVVVASTSAKFQRKFGLLTFVFTKQFPIHLSLSPPSFTLYKSTSSSTHRLHTEYDGRDDSVDDQECKS